ncbi:MAG TPA: hypothetical protein VFQ53_30730 [Kofleriaceae bacterium]|nr:hypothetical protein [Kofleriaceae bacterium]
MAALEFPRRHVGALQQLATRLIDSRKVGTKSESIARDLLAGFHGICLRSGLDRTLAELGVDDPAELVDHPVLLPALIAQIDAIDLDGGGPRNVKPRQLADCVIAALGLTVVDEPDRTLALDDTVRTQVVAAIASVVDVEAAAPRLRDTIIARARDLCEERHRPAFTKIAAQLDERGMKILQQPKVAIDAVQAIQRILFDTRREVLDRIARTAIDRAKDVIAAANPDAAARIDQPVTARLTPRDVASLRACDPALPKTPAAIAASLLESLTELAAIAWRAPERAARPYAASQTFAVGDLIDHPKFGRGSVTAVSGARIEVAFADGAHTLVHARPT